uniref:Uncharacterized protein n=1 Tax=Candidatus Kentrum sp. TUN TaxID=2126343 RepID=A0A450ZUM2_9GAMM|nr:MAG: hypothetical protein BECKTUN1418F_GA0071002_11185 [Candidatus Kentron sp. TUN]VFK65935.1 MAG: hypothetical protein BECKTUN1418E_GA0071001_11175 [Candidatus Kentron sp. TUN]
MAIMMINRLPRREIFRQHSPLRTSLVDIKDSADDDALVMLRFRTTIILRFEMVFDQRPFFCR